MMAGRVFGQHSRPGSKVKDDAGTAPARGQGSNGPVHSGINRMLGLIGRALLKLVVRWARRAQAASPHGPWIQK